MASSEKTVSRAPCSAARRLAATIFSRFPVKSPTVGLIWASAIFTEIVYRDRSGNYRGGSRDFETTRALQSDGAGAFRPLIELQGTTMGFNPGIEWALNTKQSRHAAHSSLQRRICFRQAPHTHRLPCFKAAAARTMAHG